MLMRHSGGILKFTKVYNLMMFSIFTEQCNYYHESVLGCFHTTVKFFIPLYCCSLVLTLALGNLLSTFFFFFILLKFTFQDISGHSYKCNHIVCGPLWLTTFMQHNVIKALCVVASIKTSFLYINEQYFIVQIYHILLTVYQLMNIWGCGFLSWSYYE